MKRQLITFFGMLLLPVAALAGPNYNLNWYVVDGGGGNAVASASFKLGVSAAQPVAGEVASPSFRLKMGFWYGARTCHCPFAGDPDGSGATDVLDVVAIIDRAFGGGSCTSDPGCPIERCDFDGSAMTDVLDVVAAVDYAFGGGATPCNPCSETCPRP